MRIGIAVDVTRWWPDHTKMSTDTPGVGTLIGLNHGVWRVIDVQSQPREEWDDTDHQAVAEHGDDHAPQLVHLQPVCGRETRPGRVRTWPGMHSWHVYRSEHYPVCGLCGEPTPCREREADRITEHELTVMARYETPGVCPACQEPVTGRQKSITFTDNIRVPGGPSVTYHVGRERCRDAASRYETSWAAQDPTRRTTLSCLGRITTHNDGTYECTAGDECRGPNARHETYAACSCSDCHAHGDFGCHPASNAVRRGSGNTLFEPGQA